MCRELVCKKHQYLKCKAQRKMAKEQAKICVLQKHIPKKVSTILRDHPTIEKDIEDFVEENNVGADA